MIYTNLFFCFTNKAYCFIQFLSKLSNSVQLKATIYIRMGLPIIYTLISAVHVLCVRHSLMFLFAFKLCLILWCSIQCLKPVMSFFYSVAFHIEQILNDTFVKLLVSCVNCEVFWSLNIFKLEFVLNASSFTHYVLSLNIILFQTMLIFGLYCSEINSKLQLKRRSCFISLQLWWYLSCSYLIVCAFTRYTPAGGGRCSGLVYVSRSFFP